MKKIKIIAINSKFIHSNTAVWYLHYSLLRKQLLSTIETLTINDPYDQMIRKVISDYPDVICFSCYIWNIEYVKRLSVDIKKIKPEIKIVLGGPEVSFDYEKLLNNYPIDVIIRGEGENVISNVINGDYTFGCAYIKDGTIHDTGYAILNDLEDIPFIYTPEFFMKNSNKIIYYEASRGCPYQCVYCLSSTSKGIRYLSLNRVLNELTLLANSSVKQIKFVDRTFNLEKGRTIKILQHIKNLECKCNFHLEIYPASLSKEVISFLASIPSGRVQIEAGIQSTNELTLTSSKRFQNSQLALTNSSTIINNSNIHVHLDLIAGLPFENLETFRISVNETIMVFPHMLQVGFLKGLKGTAIFKFEDYQFMEKSPYEVLVTKWLSTEQLLEIKDIENIVDDFYNSQKFRQTFLYLFKQTNSPYNLLLSIATHIKVNFDENHHTGENEKYEILLTLFNDVPLIKEYLLLDYLSTHKSKSIPSFFNYKYQLKEAVFTYFQSIGKNAKVEYKNTNIASLKFDKRQVYLFDYRIKNSVTNTFKYEIIEL
ncbi:MAG: DUF4080 domain-containing protein [Clostridiales bacterium]|nr:DUF4080 domain-containing protein [Clostridiales bacterium]